MDVAIGPYKGKETGESALLRAMLFSLDKGDIAMMDRYYCSFMMIALFTRHTGLTYCAIIASMLIALWTGKKPTLRTYEMICFYFCGMADEEELMAHIEKLKPEAA